MGKVDELLAALGVSSPTMVEKLQIGLAFARFASRVARSSRPPQFLLRCLRATENVVDDIEVDCG
jgi:hypothetical protein